MNVSQLGKMGQVVAATVGIGAGYKIGDHVVRNVYLDDLYRSTTPVTIDTTSDKWIIEKPHEPMGTFASRAMLGVGTLAAVLGGTTFAAQPIVRQAAIAQPIVGAALVGVGAGLMIDANMMSMQYRGTVAHPIP